MWRHVFGAVEAYVAAMSSSTVRERSRSRDNPRSPRGDGMRSREPPVAPLAGIRILPDIGGPGWVRCRDPSGRCNGRTFNVTLGGTLLCITCGTTMTLRHHLCITCGWAAQDEDIILYYIIIYYYIIYYYIILYYSIVYYIILYTII